MPFAPVHAFCAQFFTFFQDLDFFMRLTAPAPQFFYAKRTLALFQALYALEKNLNLLWILRNCTYGSEMSKNMACYSHVFIVLPYFVSGIRHYVLQIPDSLLLYYFFPILP